MLFGSNSNLFNQNYEVTLITKLISNSCIAGEIVLADEVRLWGVG